MHEQLNPRQRRDKRNNEQDDIFGDLRTKTLGRKHFAIAASYVWDNFTATGGEDKARCTVGGPLDNLGGKHDLAHEPRHEIASGQIRASHHLNTTLSF